MNQVAKPIRIIYIYIYTHTHTHISLVYHTENTSHTYFEINLNKDVQGNYHCFFWEPTKN